MKTRKVLALAGVTLLAAGVLAACSGGSGAKGEQTFAFTYETHPDNLNYLTTGKAATADITSNVIDGLLENDKYGNLIPSMAEDWSVSKDGLTILIRFVRMPSGIHLREKSMLLLRLKTL